MRCGVDGACTRWDQLGGFRITVEIDAVSEARQLLAAPQALRKGRLVFDHYPEPLEQLADGLFGFDGNPERWRFDCVVDGKALRLNYSGNDFYRFFTGDE